MKMGLSRNSELGRECTSVGRQPCLSTALTKFIRPILLLRRRQGRHTLLKDTMFTRSESVPRSRLLLLLVLGHNSTVPETEKAKILCVSLCIPIRSILILTFRQRLSWYRLYWTASIGAPHCHTTP